MTTDWEMPRRGEKCRTCQREFLAGERIVAELHATASGYERQDFCGACRSSPDAGCLATWLWRRSAGPSATTRPRTFDREAILGFFERLEDSADPAQAQFRFVLALLLWRKKALRFETSSSQGATEVWRFLEVRSGRTFALPRPDLDEDQIDTLSQQLESLLGGTEGPGVPETANA